MSTSSSRSWLFVTLMVLLSAMSYFQRTIISIAGVEIAHEFSLSITQMGAVYSAFVLGYALAMIPAGRVVDWWGPSLALTGFAAGTAVLTALMALPHHSLPASLSGVLAIFLVVRFCLGIVTAPLYPAAGKMNAISIPSSHRTQAQGWIIAGAGIGGALAPILFTRMISEVGWRASFLWTGAATAILGVGWHFVTRDTRSSPMEPETTPPAQWLRLFRDRNLLLLTFGYATLGYFEYLFFYWTFYYFGEVRHMAARQTAFYTSLLWIAFVIMSPLGGFVSDRVTTRWGRRVGRRVVPIVALSLSTAILASAISLHSAAEAGAAIAIAMGLCAFTEASFWAAILETSGEHAGAAGGILNTGSNAGGFTGLVFTPWIASKFGWTAGIYMGCAVAAIGILVWPFIDTTRTFEPAAAKPGTRLAGVPKMG